MRFDEGADAQAVGPGDLRPEYKVSFWSMRGGSWLEEWVGITEADADEVLAWAAREAHGRHYTVWARSISLSTDGPTNVATHIFDVRLVGTEPTASDDTCPSWAKRHTPEQGPPTGTW
jgi:hypothetical protein